MNDLTTIPTSELLAELDRRRAVIESELHAMQAWRAPTTNSVECLVAGKRIVDQVASAFGVAPAEILGRRRTPRVAKARMVAMAGLCHEGFPNDEVAQYFDRDTTTIAHALRRVKRKSPALP